MERLLKVLESLREEEGETGPLGGSMVLQPGRGHMLRRVGSNTGGNLKLRHREQAGLALHSSNFCSFCTMDISRAHRRQIKTQRETAESQVHDHRRPALVPPPAVISAVHHLCFFPPVIFPLKFPSCYPFRFLSAQCTTPTPPRQKLSSMLPWAMLL